MAAVVMSGCSTSTNAATSASPQAGVERDLRGAAEHLAMVVDELLGTSGPAPSIELSSTHEALAGTGLAAATVWSGSGQPRVIIDPAAITGVSGEAIDALIAHELVHVRMQPQTAPATPTWVVEGFADLIGFAAANTDVSQLRGVAVAGGIPIGMPTDAAFHEPGAARDAAYAHAFLLWRYIADISGIPASRAIYEAFAGGGDPGAFELALESATGMRSPQLLAAWRNRLAAEG